MIKLLIDGRFPFIHRIPTPKKGKGYVRLPVPGEDGNDMFIVQSSAAFTLADLKGHNWPDVRYQMLRNIKDVFDFLIEEVEDDVRP